MNLSEIKITPLLDTLRLQKISDEEYFSEVYKDYISNSRLGLIDPTNEGSPEKFLDGLRANKIFSDSLSLGTVVHEQTLQPDLFNFPPSLNRPTAKVGFIADELWKIAKNPLNFTKSEFETACLTVDYYKGNPSDEKRKEIYPKIQNYFVNLKNFCDNNDSSKISTFLDDNTLVKAKNCVEALKNNKKVQNLLHPKGLIDDPISECEQAILLDAKVKVPGLDSFIVRLKSKLDNYTIDKESNLITVNDVKTIGRTLDKCDEQIMKYHYYREMYMYCYLLILCAQKFYNMDKFKVRSNFLWVSTLPTCYTKVTPMTQKLFETGKKEFKELLRRAAIALYFKDAVEASTFINGL